MADQTGGGGKGGGGGGRGGGKNPPRDPREGFTWVKTPGGQWREKAVDPVTPVTAVTPVTPVVPSPGANAEDSEEYLEYFISSSMGISGLGKWASTRKDQGYSLEWIQQAIRYGTDTSEAGKAAYASYLAAFPGMQDFLGDGTFIGANPELQYMQYIKSAKEAAIRFGVGDSLVTSDKIESYLRNGIDAAEIVARMSTAAAAVATTPTETLAILNQYYGVGSSDLITFFLDPTETEAMLQTRYTAATIGTEAARQKFGVDVTEAESLATRGINAGAAAKGFGTAAERRSFMGGAGETASREELIGASFGDQAAEEKVARVSGSRAGRFQEGGSFVSNARGVSGLGSSATR